MRHFYKNIQGWSIFLPLYTEAVNRAPKSGAVFVEIGAWRGRSAAYMGVEIANSGKEIHFYTVDHFNGSPNQIARGDQVLVDGLLYSEFTKNTAPVAKYITVLKMTSLEASKRFDDGSIDFILIDGDHEYESVREDLHAWYPKLKPDGVIAGDDWRKPGVNRAVKEFFGALGHKITPIFGKLEKKAWVVR